MCLWLGFPGLLSSRLRPVKHQSGPPRPSPKPSSKAEASRQEVALPSRAKTSQRWHMLFYERRPLTADKLTVTSSTTKKSRQEVALPNRAVKLRSNGTCSSTHIFSQSVGGGGPRAQRVLDKKTGTKGPQKDLQRTFKGF